ncbi:cysteine desulfurase [miscellaneous Crenarchaeota group-1 archaeon SG8-32-1]|uniref:Cysteine desulfurase IscS n=1 Tax=miscellaneous Crenarchaeota group-1 archaeon SG8-32-1 TaxID=1685124 RepID=A0A0M0BYV6_9ARCH|nr:MAG: cysteine desulfurase [miscellaneous Crenarchaeota group-1 archaeon SG8-32-1]
MKVYMDYAATTPIDPRVFSAMKPYFTKKFGNTMSLHSIGREAKKAVEDSRESIATILNCETPELIFTSSATESTNTILKGVAFANRKKGRHIVISSIEHHCVLEPARWLEKQGFEITRLPVDKFGLIEPIQIEEAIRNDTILVSVMHANNEIGTIQDITKIGAICKEKGVHYHSDAAQSFGKIPIDVKKMNIDLLSISSHKMYGPKGVGGLYIKKGTKIEPLLHGGGHEFSKRASTTNVAGIVGFAEATIIQDTEMESDAKKQTYLRDKIIKQILKIEDTHLNGHSTKRLPNNTNFWFNYIEGESLLMQLDIKGIAASTGSACSSDSLEASHVLLAIGLRPQEAHGSLRLSLGKYTTNEEVNYVLEIVSKSVKRLREISPLTKENKDY